MLAQGAAMAQASPPSQSNTIDKTAQTAPESEVTSGQKVTGHTRTHKDVASRTSPEQPASATREKVKPSDRLRNWRNLSKDQVAPPADAPVKPGTNVAPGQDIPKPRAN
jgi:hypothetical protein